MGSRFTFTFAVVGHNEGQRLHVALGQAFAAATPADRVVFVDSGSDDESRARAVALGAEVIAAPLGKGRAVAAALDACTTDYIGFCDADLESSSRNIPAALRDAANATGADMIVGAFTEPVRRWAITPGIYLPLVRALFPDALATNIEVPLSGLRAFRASIDRGVLPVGYGIETHMNIHVPLSGGTVANCTLGEFIGPLRGFANLPRMGADVAGAVLDLAEAHGRLATSGRAEWDRWVSEVVEVVRTMPPPGADDTAYRGRLTAAAARPLPSTLADRFSAPNAH